MRPTPPDIGKAGARCPRRPTCNRQHRELRVAGPAASTQCHGPGVTESTRVAPRETDLSYCAGVNVGPTILTERLPGLAVAAAGGVSDAASVGAATGMLPVGLRVS